MGCEDYFPFTPQSYYRITEHHREAATRLDRVNGRCATYIVEIEKSNHIGVLCRVKRQADENYNHFNEAMANEHRTLQQFFMKLIVNYIRFAASDAYRTDGRNKASKELAIQLNCTLNDMVVYLPCI